MPEEPVHQDFRQSEAGKRQSWHGAKRLVKSFLGLRVPNALMRSAVRLKPGVNARGRLPAPRHVKEVEGSVGGTSFTMLRPDVCIIAKELYWGSGSRPAPSDQYALTSFVRLAGSVDVVIDIGAYTGLFTVASAKAHQELRCHAFELLPDVFRLLFDNCVRNDVLDRTTLHPTAIGKPGTVLVPARSTGSALPDFYSTRLHFSDGVKVRVAPMDELLGGFDATDRLLIKIDVEGTEAEVLRSGIELLTRHSPDILCEVLPASAPAEDLEDLLGSRYNYYLVRDDDVLDSSRILTPPSYRDWWFSTKQPAELEQCGVSVSRKP